MRAPADRRPDGVPTDTNPSVTIANFGAAPIGVPNPVIDSFSIPPFLLPIYQACGTQYGIPWQVLASINRIETAFGTNLNVSTAGALGWMQFMPSTWRMYGVDANNDGRKDPVQPGRRDLRRRPLPEGGRRRLRPPPRRSSPTTTPTGTSTRSCSTRNQYGKLPEALVGSLTGLTEGDRFPVAANARYADDISEREALKRSKPGKGQAGNVADVISGSPTRRGINIYSREGAPVVAVNDGVITRIGKSKDLGHYIVLRDAYGNRFTYAQLGDGLQRLPSAEAQQLSANDFRLVSPHADDSSPGRARDRRRASAAAKDDAGKDAKQSADAAPADDGDRSNTEDSRDRLFALPERKHNVDRADLSGQLDSLLAKKMPGYESFKGYFSTSCTSTRRRWRCRRSRRARR